MKDLVMDYRARKAEGKTSAHIAGDYIDEVDPVSTDMEKIKRVADRLRKLSSLYDKP